MQYDFVTPHGSLYVEGSDQIITNIENIMLQFDWELIVFTQDWHPTNHISFYTSHKKKCIGQTIKNIYGEQELWPPHCVQNSLGAQIIPQLIKHIPYIVIQKGYHKDIDSYSGFGDKSGKFLTGLNEILHTNKISNVFICGVSANYCVKFTTIDSVKNGYKTYVIADAVATVSGDLSKDLILLESNGAILTYSNTW